MRRRLGLSSRLARVLADESAARGAALSRTFGIASSARRPTSVSGPRAAPSKTKWAPIQVPSGRSPWADCLRSDADRAFLPKRRSTARSCCDSVACSGRGLATARRSSGRLSRRNCRQDINVPCRKYRCGPLRLILPAGTQGYSDSWRVGLNLRPRFLAVPGTDTAKPEREES